MTQVQAVIRGRAGSVRRITCLHRHAERADALSAECSVWEIKTGTEADFDIKVKLESPARRSWEANNPGIPFCPGVELPIPNGERRFGGATGVVEALLHHTDLRRDAEVVVDAEGTLSLIGEAKATLLRDPDGNPIRIELSLPEGSSPL
jgi:hypothetical protein